MAKVPHRIAMKKSVKVKGTITQNMGRQTDDSQRPQGTTQKKSEKKEFIEKTKVR